MPQGSQPKHHVTDSKNSTKAVVPAQKKVSALDAAISRGETLPSKNKYYPGDSDVTTTPSKGKPVIKVKQK